MNRLKTTLLLGAMTGLLLLIGEVVAGRDGVTLALVFAAVMNVGAWFFSDKIVLSMYGAQPVDQAQAPELHAIVQKLAQKANIPMPRLYLLPDRALNAFATGRGPSHAAVAATAGIVSAMDAEELEGVLAHELSHVIHRDTLVSTVAATLAGAISWAAHMSMYRGRDDRNGGGGLALLLFFLAPLGAFLIQLAVSRSREYGADEGGARLVGYPDGLIRALRKLQTASERIPMDHVEPATAHMFIVNPLAGMGGVAKLFSTHPPLEDRIARLMAMKG
jgi:heat shock protein HtpX